MAKYIKAEKKLSRRRRQYDAIPVEHRGGWRRPGSMNRRKQG